jgi:hypothetical protein
MEKDEFVWNQREKEILDKFPGLDEWLSYLVSTPSDINEHLPVLKDYALKCETIVEMGVRTACSTAALLSARPKKMTSYDVLPSWNGIRYPKIVEELARRSKIDGWSFVNANVLRVEIESTDLLFIDTLHTFNQLTKELALHASKVKKYIVLHDTTTFEYRGEDGSQFGLWNAVLNFLENNETEWEIVERRTNDNGLTVLGKRRLRLES